ncbi:hypothetical protein NDR87_27480 [Nocardia sp. CDC159]|uniref:Uncharacterized protein n=1 Tax=Nocardia pulmonis TaxID=2951408 RepID=A0A9X2J0P5_9NOCA|nr:MULTISPECIES: hypothetical protein [Nocardia]MCM6777235.1 hypothetical protein [Nocardia pulmonis]MCM6790120.1 hypothetical protein [Nocardia sp. CDC159]
MTTIKPTAGYGRAHKPMTPSTAPSDNGRVSEFLALGDGIVRHLLDALLRMDDLRAVLDDTRSTPAQRDAAYRNVHDVVADLEEEIRSSNTIMLDIAASWPMTASAYGRLPSE